MTAKIEWCQWCDQEHPTDFLCDKALAALKDLANLGESAQPVRHYGKDVRLEDLDIDMSSVEFMGGIGFDGSAIQIDGEWYVLLILRTEDTDGNKYPVRMMATPVMGFERLRDWTMQVFDTTIAKTKKLNEEGK